MHSDVREEARKFWDYFVSDEIVYGTQAVDINFEIARSVDTVDWLSEYDSGRFYIELKFVFFGEQDTYYHCILETALVDPVLRNALRSNTEGDMTNGDESVLIDVAKFVELPQGMLLEHRPSVIRLKRFNDGERYRRDVRDFFVVPSVAGSGAFGLNREGRVAPRRIGSEQGQLPCEVIETGTKGIGKLSNQHANRNRSGFLLNAYTMPRALNIVLSRNEVGIFPKFGHFPFEFIETYIRPTTFHLCMGQANPQWHMFTSEKCVSIDA
jgi:hypothetical protein